MQILDAAAVAAALPYAELVDTLEEAFRRGATVPRRTRHALDLPGEPQSSLLLMPAWRPGGALGVKIVSVLPGNAKRGLGAVQATYLLMDALTGAPRCVLDGGELTLRRTAAASALASRYLSREASRTLLMVGTGRLAPHLVRAHAAVRPIREVLVWGRRESAARDLAKALSAEGFRTAVCGELQAAVGRADLISCATLATDPLIMGSWLGPGQHLDLVGAFTPQMREADTEAVKRADVYVDTFEGAFAEAGELVQAIAAGAIAQADVRADLAALCRGERPGRETDTAITLFKSVGTALEDLAAAELAVQGNCARVLL